MDIPRSAKIRAIGVDDGEGAEAEKILGRIQSRNGAANPAQRQKHREAGARTGGWGDRTAVEQAEIEAGRGPVGALKHSEREELVELRRENQRLRMEREILKNESNTKSVLPV